MSYRQTQLSYEWIIPKKSNLEKTIERLEKMNQISYIKGSQLFAVRHIIYFSN